jgi:anaerobic ribonucleoside-triphosphate reductase
VGSNTNPIERVKLEGRFHPLIEAGAITHVWLGEQHPSKESMANFVIKIFTRHQERPGGLQPRVHLLPRTAAPTSRGIKETCPACGSDELDHITRITGYFTRVSSWNKGKLGELKDRYRNNGFFAATPMREAV